MAYGHPFNPVPYVSLTNCKKRFAIFPSQAGMSQSNSPWPGIFKFFPARESLVSDIPAENGKIIYLFLQCGVSMKLWNMPTVIFFQKLKPHMLWWRGVRCREGTIKQFCAPLMMVFKKMLKIAFVTSIFLLQLDW
jgi:hypothetical protein